MLAICASVDAINEGHAAIVEAVRDEEIGMDRIDRSIQRITSLKNELRTPLPFDDNRLNALSDEIFELNARLT